MRKNPSKAVSVILWIVGLNMMLAGGYLTKAAYTFNKTAVEVLGTVISLEVNHSDDSTTYKPTIRFLDVQGQKHTVQTYISSSSYDYDIGQKVSILYDPDSPNNIRINSWFSIWGFGLILFVTGAVILIMARASKSRKPMKSTVSAQDNTPQKTARQRRLVSMESPEDHAREAEYAPTVRRN